MPKSMSEIQHQFSVIEPTDRMFDGIGPAEVGSLHNSSTTGKDLLLATRAVHALSRIDTEGRPTGGRGDRQPTAGDQAGRRGIGPFAASLGLRPGPVSVAGRP